MADGTWEWIGVGITLVGFVMVGVSFVVGLRARRRRRPGALAGLSRGERNRALRQLRGRVPVDPAEQPRLRRVAGDVLGTRFLFGSTTGVALTQIGQTLGHHSLFRTMLALVVLLLSASGAGLLWRDVAAARRFLRRYPA